MNGRRKKGNERDKGNKRKKKEPQQKKRKKNTVKGKGVIEGKREGKPFCHRATQNWPVGIEGEEGQMTFFSLFSPVHTLHCSLHSTNKRMPYCGLVYQHANSLPSPSFTATNVCHGSLHCLCTLPNTTHASTEMGLVLFFALLSSMGRVCLNWSVRQYTGRGF